MKIKEIIKQAEAQAIPLADFCKLVSDNGYTINQIAKFLLRLENLRKGLK